MTSSPEQYVEQYLLFDNSEYIKGIGYIGQVALIEMVSLGEQDGMQELLPPQVADVDHWSRLFEV